MDDRIAEIYRRIDRYEKEIAPAKLNPPVYRLLIGAINYFCEHEYTLMWGTTDEGTKRCHKCGDEYYFNSEALPPPTLEELELDLYVSKKFKLKYYQERLPEELLATACAFLTPDEVVLIRRYLNHRIVAWQRRIEKIEVAMEERR